MTDRKREEVIRAANLILECLKVNDIPPEIGINAILQTLYSLSLINKITRGDIKKIFDLFYQSYEEEINSSKSS